MTDTVTTDAEMTDNERLTMVKYLIKALEGTSDSEGCNKCIDCMEATGREIAKLLHPMRRSDYARWLRARWRLHRRLPTDCFMEFDHMDMKLELHLVENSGTGRDMSWNYGDAGML